MDTTRRLITDEFKREAVELLASSGRPLSQIAGELGIAASMLRAWRNKGDGGQAGSPRHPQYAGGDPACRGGSGGRKRPPAARERTLAHGTGDSKKTLRIFSEAPR
jgi:transposase